MRKKIKLDLNEITAILEQLPESQRKKLQAELGQQRAKDIGFELLKAFVTAYEEDDAVDNLLSFTCATIISKISKGLDVLTTQFKKEGKEGFRRLDMASIVIQVLREEANEIESVLLADKITCCNKTHH